MITDYRIFAYVIAYLIGSIPSAVWIGRRFYGVDVRQHGSKNGGATNAIRVLGFKVGISVFIIDALKGFIAVYLAYWFKVYSPGSDDFVRFQIFLGITAVLGHIFPIYVGFKGGKGVATLFGLILAIHTPAAIVAVLIFTTVLLLSKYVSLSSMITGFLYPFVLIFIFKVEALPLIVFSMVVTILLLITHQKNIERLLKGEESKASFLVKKR